MTLACVFFVVKYVVGWRGSHSSIVSVFMHCSSSLFSLSPGLTGKIVSVVKSNQIRLLCYTADPKLDHDTYKKETKAKYYFFKCILQFFLIRNNIKWYLF